jgi:hypothetical protein
MGPETQIALYMLVTQFGWMAVPLGAFVTALGFAIGVPLARAYSRRMDAESASLRFPADVADRLARMERAIDSVAIEVERISEGQRFRTKQITEEKDARENPQISPGGKPPQDRNK